MDSGQDNNTNKDDNSTTEQNSKVETSCCSGTSCSGDSKEKCGISCLKDICDFSKLDLKWIAEKIQQVMLDPKGCWDKLKLENLSPKDMYAKYLFPLALVAAICSFIGASVIGISTGFNTFRVPFFSGLIFQVATFAVSLLGYSLMALIIEKLAPKFGTQVSFSKALLLVGFSATPGLIAGLFSLFPSPLFGLVALLLSIYSLYILWSGFDKITEVIAEKKIAFFASSVVCSILAMVFLQIVSTAIFGPRIPDEVFDQKQFEESIKKLVPQEN